MSREWLCKFAPSEVSQLLPICPQYKAPQPSLTVRCASCNEDDATKKCAGCKITYYCKEQCQKDDWKLHKLVCKPYIEFINNVPRPKKQKQNEGSFKLAIFLPVDEKQLKFFWLETCKDMSENLYTLEIGSPQMISEYLGSEPTEICTSTVRLIQQLLQNFPDEARYIQARQLEIEIVPFHVPEYSMNPLNKCAKKLANNRMMFGWRGPIVVVHRIPETRSIGDIQPSDIRIIADWFRRYKPLQMQDFYTRYTFEGETDEVRMLEHLHHVAECTAPRVSAVVVRCDGGTEILKRSKYEKIELSFIDPTFFYQETHCTKALGIPLITHRYTEDYDILENDDSAALDHGTIVPHRNPELPFLHLTIDPEDSNWGGLSPREMAAYFPLREIGTWLIARKDQKCIDVHQVEAIANYFRRVVYVKMGDLIHQHNGTPSTAEKKRVTDALLNQEALEEYFEKFKKAKVEAGDASWSTSISPFDA
ncbi:hypothetical protein MFRU_005g01130 [Monilinia fructicola]|uniref:MYND-type domain-containing protein n=1 Tax=Monilinia fructicola TaxID=38448 RepID=A0A5M9JPM2_MONFR|nr:hypothetical protein EYC84_002297 [Monilinia fructicola]KAG4033096.1 hypothetical protein MFRU_005g01130 [Monilinia fructicola]